MMETRNPEIFPIGTMMTLLVRRLAGPGARLAHPDEAEGPTLLLPRRYLPENLKENDSIEVFVYSDSDDRPIATTLVPKVKRGEIALLRVKEVTDIGAFLDWGIDKDLFLPFAEQIGRPQLGEEILVTLRIDREGRSSATMKIDELLQRDSSYEAGEMVPGRIWNRIADLGLLVAVDDRYAALLPLEEFGAENPQRGECFRFRVNRRRETGELEVSLRKALAERMDEDAQMLLEKLGQAGGFLALHDKSEPERIRQVLGLSKAAFKRALGRLIKAGKVQVEADGIRLR